MLEIIGAVSGGVYGYISLQGLRDQRDQHEEFVRLLSAVDVLRAISTLKDPASPYKAHVFKHDFSGQELTVFWAEVKPPTAHELDQIFIKGQHITSKDVRALQFDAEGRVLSLTKESGAHLYNAGPPPSSRLSLTAVVSGAWISNTLGNNKDACLDRIRVFSWKCYGPPTCVNNLPTMGTSERSSVRADAAERRGILRPVLLHQLNLRVFTS